MRDILQTGCLILGVLFFFYFIIIVCHAGLSEWFMWVWLLASCVCLFQWFLLKQLNKVSESYLGGIVNAVFIMEAAALFLIVWFGSKVLSGMYEIPKKKLDYVIVLGARVRDDQPTRALRKRLDKALEYACENPDTILILSGGKGPDEGISEARCMYDYLIGKGIDEVRLRMEDHSTSTVENLRFSQEFLDKDQDFIGIVSNNFHIYRALLLARKEGYQKVCGIPAPSDFWMQPHYVLREIAALVKIKVFSNGI